jgi:peptide/nickel transport system ATP-binding protein
MTDLLALNEVAQVFGVSHLTHAVDQVSFQMPEQPAILNLVGESGSGKSTLARIVLRLQKPTAGQVLYKGRDVFDRDRRWQREYRREVQGVFQNPYGAYNPFYRVERIFTQAIRKLGLPIPRGEARERIAESLRAVDLRPNDVLGKYPHQLSGGMRQRVMMARIHLIRPRLVIADEPVSMVDAGIRASFLNILLDFRDRLGISTLFITHDLSTAEYLGGQIIVLYKGRIVERGETAGVTASPLHPYAQLLMKSIPVADPSRRWQEELQATPEQANPRAASRERCLYAERCPFVMEACWGQQPPARVVSGAGQPEREAACHLHAAPGNTR